MTGMRITRRALCGGGLALAAAPVRGQEPERDITYGQDFDELWETLRDRYCFFSEKTTAWDEVRAWYRPMAVAAESGDAFSGVVRRVLFELYDSHTNLQNGPEGTPRVPPFDLIVDRQARITAVQGDSAAAAAGLRIGDEILAAEGVPIREVARELAPRCLATPDPKAELWAINAAVSGNRMRPRRLTVRSADGAPAEVLVSLRDAAQPPAIAGRMLDGGVGYIAIRSFSDRAYIEAFDVELEKMAEAPALIIDVRGNGGGNTNVARPIMGRFITERRPYARMRRRDGAGLGPAWTEYVDPRGPFTYDRPVVILTDRWSGSMAEGFPMGMRGLGRATVVGTPMMGLGAAVFSLRLDRTGVQAQYSAEPVYDVHDQPRWLMRPDVEVRDGEDILAAGLAEAGRLAARA